MTPQPSEGEREAIARWLIHDGGRCPVAPETMVRVRYRARPFERRESTSAPARASWFQIGTDWWRHQSPNRSNDIIAYCLMDRPNV